jgi:ABC-type polysaccharide/polyol phosphate export permease
MVGQEISWSQVRTLTSASIRSRYRNTFVGLLWVVISPVIMFSVQGYVFKSIMHINVDHYPAWVFFFFF